MFMQNVDIKNPLILGIPYMAKELYCSKGDMRYVDICSLYPYVLKHRPFLIGHPGSSPRISEM